MFTDTWLHMLPFLQNFTVPTYTFHLNCDLFRYYVGAGLLLYGFDKGIRMINSSRQHTMESIVFDKDSSVTTITLPGKTFPR